MNQQRWQYLKALQPPAGRYLHIACNAWMQPNPLGDHLPPIPKVEHGTPYNIGRNAEKRARKAAAKSRVS